MTPPKSRPIQSLSIRAYSWWTVRSSRGRLPPTQRLPFPPKPSRRSSERSGHCRSDRALRLPEGGYSPFFSRHLSHARGRGGARVGTEKIELRQSGESFTGTKRGHRKQGGPCTAAQFYTHLL